MLYMIVERFKPGKAPEVYSRTETQGRLLPDGLEYLNSWVSDDLKNCYQVVSCDERELIDQWIALWSDLVDFEVIQVISSAEAAERAKKL